MGVPDTMFSIPARTKMKGFSVSGYVYIEDGVLYFEAEGRGRDVTSGVLGGLGRKEILQLRETLSDEREDRET